MGPPPRSPLLAEVPCCTHRWSRVSRGSRLSWHPGQTPLAHGAALALQPLWRGGSTGISAGIPNPLIPTPNPKFLAVLTTPARPAGPGCPGLPGGPWGQKWGGHRGCPHCDGFVTGGSSNLR